MRKYRIKEIDLGYNVEKVFKNDEGIITKILYRNGKWRDSRKKCAKTYYFKDEALSGLMVAKRCLESDLYL